MPNIYKGEEFRHRIMWATGYHQRRYAVSFGDHDLIPNTLAEFSFDIVTDIITLGYPIPENIYNTITIGMEYKETQDSNWNSYDMIRTNEQYTFKDFVLPTPSRVSTAMSDDGKSIKVSWPSVSGPRPEWGQVVRYNLEISPSGGSYEKVTTTDTSYHVAIKEGWRSVQFMLRAFCYGQVFDFYASPYHVPTSHSFENLRLTKMPEYYSSYVSSSVVTTGNISAPVSIIVPPIITINSNPVIEWGESAVENMTVTGYDLQHSIDGGSFSDLATTQASVREYTATIGDELNTIQYRVRGIAGQNQSEFTTSDIRTIVHNQPPTISGEDKDLGNVGDGLRYDYTVTDPENDEVTVVEKISDTIIRTHTPPLGETQSAVLDGDLWASLPLEKHTLTITATDSEGGSYTRTITFTKTVTSLSVSLEDPLPSDGAPSRININLSANIPTMARLCVEVCNNAYDETPTWEDATQATLSNIAHVFTNKIKTASEWGVNVRVKVERNGAFGDCYLSGIAVHFE